MTPDRREIWNRLKVFHQKENLEVQFDSRLGFASAINIASDFRAINVERATGLTLRSRLA